MAREGLTDQKTKTQRDRFIETARDLGCDEDEDRFNDKLKKVAKRTTKTPERPEDG